MHATQAEISHARLVQLLDWFDVKNGAAHRTQISVLVCKLLLLFELAVRTSNLNVQRNRFAIAPASRL